MHKSRELSKEQTLEEINCDSLKRIANAVELMSKKAIEMQEDLDYYKSKYHEELSKRIELDRSNAILRGVVTRLKNRKFD